MKKAVVCLIVVFLSACETPTLDIRQELISTLNAQRSFSVDESFEWNRFATLNNAPWNEFVEITTSIDFETNRYFTQHQLDEETNTNRVIERTLFDAATYKNIYSRNAAVRIDRRWYNVELPVINAMGLGSFDPVLVVSELLFNNTELYYKSDAGVTGDISSYRIAVVTIDDVQFEELFEHSVAPYVNVPYAYTVTAELRFNDQYEITDIEFDLSRLLRQYRDYFSVQQGVVFNSLTAQFSLTYHRYNEVNVSELPLGLLLQPSANVLTNPEEAVTSSVLIQPTFTTLSESSLGEREVRVDIISSEEGRVALIELLGMANGQQVFFEQRLIVPVDKNTFVSLPPISNANALDELYLSIRFVKRQSPSVIFETLDVTTNLKAHLGE